MRMVIAFVVAFVILGFIPLRVAILHRRGTLTAGRFSWTFAPLWSLAFLVIFYIGLSDVLVSQGDPVLSALGLVIAGLNFVVFFPFSRFLYKNLLQALEKTDRK